MNVSGFLSERDRKTASPEPVARQGGVSGIYGYVRGSDVEEPAMPMNEDLAFNLAAVWCCVRVVAEAVGIMPTNLVDSKGGEDRDEAVDHPGWWLLKKEPNPEMTPMTFKETLQAHVMTWGNCYAEIERAVNGKPLALWPITPERVTPDRDDATGQLFYRVTQPDGEEVGVAPKDMLHVAGLGWDGILGYSVIQYARRSLGLAAAADHFGNSFFANGSIPGGVLEHPGTLKDTAHQRLRQTWESIHKGVRKAHRIAILEEGMKFNAIGIPPQDAQLLETRKFQIYEICRWFRVPPHMVYELERATNANVEAMGDEFVKFTLLAWLRRWCDQLDRKLLTPRERVRKSFEFDTAPLLRGDMLSRFRAYAIGRQWGWLSANDVRREENDRRIEKGGDVYLAPANMQDVGAPGSLGGAAGKGSDPEGDAAKGGASDGK